MNPKTLRSKHTYIDKVLNTRRDNLIGYWPLNETSGNIAYDFSGNNYHGVMNNCLLGQSGIGDGRNAVYFNGVNSSINLYPALTKFNANEGTLILWVLPAWSLGNNYALHMQGKTVNFSFLIQCIAGTYAVCRLSDSSKFYAKFTTVDDLQLKDFTFLALSWSLSSGKGNCKITAGTPYLDLNEGIYTITRPYTRLILGDSSTTPTDPYGGYMSNFGIWNTALSDEELLNLGVIP